MEIFERELLEYRFSAGEIRERGDKVCRLTIELTQLEDRKKQIIADFKAKQEKISSEMRELATSVNNGYEMRSVECRWIMNHPVGGVKTLIRSDTGEEVRSTGMSFSERQEHLPFEAPIEQPAAEAEPPTEEYVPEPGDQVPQDFEVTITPAGDPQPIVMPERQAIAALPAANLCEHCDQGAEVDPNDATHHIVAGLRRRCLARSIE